MSEDDELWMLVRALVRKSAADALAHGRGAGSLADVLQGELEVLGRRAGRTEDAFRTMVLAEIEAAVQDHRSKAGSSDRWAPRRG